MLGFKYAAAGMMVLAAFATTAASATETLWTGLPGAEGTKFTGNSGKVSVQIKGSGAIACPAASAEGEIQKEKTLGLALLKVGGKCGIGGLPVDSLGDESGVVLVHVEMHDCVIGAGHAGVLVKVLPLHLEVPAAKLLVTLEGTYILEVTPNKKTSKTFSLIVEQKEGMQKIEKCEGGTAQTLKTSLDGGEFRQSAVEAKEAELTFTSIEQEAMA